MATVDGGNSGSGSGGAAVADGPGADDTIDATGAAGVSASAARVDHGHKLSTYSSAAAAIGTAAAGTSTTAPSRGNHVHATGAGTPSTQAFGDAAATGTGPAAAMTDHKHAWPALGTSAAAVGTSAGGSATTPSKSDHVHATGAGTPASIGLANAVGSGPAAAMTDHVHTSGTMLKGYATGDLTSLNSTALADATGIAFAIAASEEWLFRFVLFVTNAANTADIKLAFTGPASPTTVIWSASGLVGGATALGSSGYNTTASVALGTTQAIGVISSIYPITGEGYIKNGANAGTIQLQFAQNTVDATNATTVKAGSSITAWRVA